MLISQTSGSASFKNWRGWIILSLFKIKVIRQFYSFWNQKPVPQIICPTAYCVRTSMDKLSVHLRALIRKVGAGKKRLVPLQSVSPRQTQNCFQVRVSTPRTNHHSQDVQTAGVWAVFCNLNGISGWKISEVLGQTSGLSCEHGVFCLRKLRIKAEQMSQVIRLLLRLTVGNK